MNERRSLQLLAEKYEQVLEGRPFLRGGRTLTFSDETRNQILSIYKNGKDNDIKDDTNVIKLAQRFNLSTGIIRKILRQSGFGRVAGYTQIGKNLVPGSQKIPPDQIEYINKLISLKDKEGVYEYSSLVITKMVNEYTDAHPELNWYKIALHNSSAVEKYIKEWEKEKLKPGETRMNFGIRASNGRIYGRGPGLRIRAPRVFNPNNNSYQATMARGQPINDQAYQVKGSPTVTPPV